MITLKSFLVKGLECDNVFVCLGAPKMVMKNYDRAEEARLEYVAITRAKKKVVLFEVGQQPISPVWNTVLREFGLK